MMILSFKGLFIKFIFNPFATEKSAQTTITRLGRHHCSILYAHCSYLKTQGQIQQYRENTKTKWFVLCFSTKIFHHFFLPSGNISQLEVYGPYGPDF